MAASTTTTAVDLSRLPAPSVIDRPTYDAIHAALLADLIARCVAAGVTFNAAVESDPAVKLLEVAAYRELLLRQAVQDAGLQVMVAYATGGNLDQLAAIFGVARLEMAPANPLTGAVAVMEADTALRARIILAPESYSVAGPELAYVYHAKSASAAVADASASSPAPGEVVVSVLAVDGDGTAPPALVAAVAAVVGARTVRPLTDHVTVQSATIVPFALTAAIYTYAGPDASIVLDAGRAKLAAYLAVSRALGRDVTTSGLIAALTVEGVQRVVLASPLADIVCDATQAAYCAALTITHGGYGS